MPQLVPFYFVNQVTFVFFLIVVLLYVFSKYLLPKFVCLFLTRNYITNI